MALTNFERMIEHNHSTDALNYYKETMCRLQDDMMRTSSLSLQPRITAIPDPTWKLQSGFDTMQEKAKKATEEAEMITGKLTFKFKRGKWTTATTLKGDTMQQRNWEFSVAHEKVICLDEVDKYVTRANPLAFVHHGNVLEFMIHQSIVAKATILKKSPKFFDDLLQSGDTSIFFGTSTPDQIKKITEKVRGVKRAKWGKKADRQQVRVIVPKI